MVPKTQVPSSFQSLLDALAQEHLNALQGAHLRPGSACQTAEHSHAEISNLRSLCSSIDLHPDTPTHSSQLGCPEPPPRSRAPSQVLSVISMELPKEDIALGIPTLPGMVHPTFQGCYSAPLPLEPTELKARAKDLWATVRKMVNAGEMTEEAYRRRQLSLRRSSFDSVRLKQIWKQGSQVGLEVGHRSSTGTSARLRRSSAQLWEAHSKGTLERFILKPDDKKHLAWDIMSLMVLSYDVLSTPLEVFDLPDTAFMRSLSLITLCFWTMDILVSFISGYHTVAGVETRPQKIALNYVKTWFLVDFATVALEWLSQGSAVVVLRFGKFARGFRVIRMLRIVKVRVLFEEVDDFIRSETVMGVFKISRLVILIVVVNHFVACGWWAVGTLPEGVTTRWTDGMPDELAYQYLTTLHWALTQFTPASMEVAPTNTWERAYTISVMVLGLLVFSSFLSSISSQMTQLRQKQAARAQEDMLIRRYLIEHDVSFPLGSRVLFFYRQNRASLKKKRLVEQDVSAFEVLPDNLKTELHWEVFGPVVMRHPLFCALHDEFHSGVVEVCHRCMSEKLLGNGCEVFHYGKAAESMYFTVKGVLHYLPGQVHYSDMDRVHLGADQWISEMVLWMKWIHQGTLSTGSDSTEIMLFNSMKFHEHVRVHCSCFDLCRQYAKFYVQRIIDFCEDMNEMPTDTWGSGMDDGEAIQELVHDAQERMKHKRKDPSTGVSLWGIFFDPKDGRNMRAALSRLASRTKITDIS